MRPTVWLSGRAVRTMHLRKPEPSLANRAAHTQGEALSAAAGVGRLSFGLFATLDELFKPTAMHTKQSVH